MKFTHETFRRIRVSLVAAAFVFTSILPGPLGLIASAADLVVTAHDKTYVAGGGYQTVDPNLTISGSGDVTGAKVYFGSEYVAGSDHLSYTNEYGISGSFNSSTGVLTVSGTASIAYYQDFLRKVTYSTGATGGSKTVFFSVSQGSTSTYYYSGTGHFYEYVASAGNYWTTAKSLAESRSITVNGQTIYGYLATITSSGENAFVADKCAGNGWIGASDADSEGVWKWVTGPESGTQFWQGLSSSNGGYSVSSRYSNWHSGEPNDANGEDYAHMYSDDGTWNDFSNTNTGTSGYLVEYGTTSISLESSSIDSCTVTIIQYPTSVSIAASPTSTTTMSLTWSAVGATSYTVYRDGSAIYSGSATSYTDTGLGVNTRHTYYVAAANTAGSTNSSSISKYTYAEAPGLTVVNEATFSINDWSLSIGNNPAGTTYLVQYSTNGSTWNTLYSGQNTSGTHAGLSEDTTYYYRACAYNGDSAASSYSATKTVKTNDCPVITNLNPTVNIYKSAVTGYTTVTLSGTVTDHDNDNVALSATLNGKTVSTTATSTSAGAAWSLTWDIVTDTFNEGSFTSVVISANDGTGKSNAGSSETWTKTLYVDKTAPAAPTIENSTAWTNAASVPVTVTNGADASGTVNSGSSYSEYRYKTVDADTGETVADWTAWTTYGTLFTITTAGITTIEARTYDIVGNMGEAKTSTVRIDRTSPTSSGSFTVQATYGDTVYTRIRTVDITGISAGDAGAGVELPTYMQLCNSSSFTAGTYTQVAYADTYSAWSLTDTDGEKTVYIRFVDAVGNIGGVCSDTIIYDSTPPVVSVSAPSRYAVKNGLSVSYTLSVNDATATIVGINGDDLSFLTLTASGTIENNLGEMPGWVVITEPTATTRKVTVTIPESVTNEGTVAISVNAAAATDPAGNTSAQVPGNFSFNVDCTPPSNQGLLFPDDLTVSGGEAVTLAVASASCEGGQAGDSVRFAGMEAYGTDYDGTDPADGETITSTHGRSVTIIAPTKEGTYKLYIIDEAGNISQASTATLTVKNVGPRVTIDGPSETHVKAESTVEYLVTFSADTADISLGQEDVALVRTGTANAYVTVGEIEDEPLCRSITLSNLMGEGTVAIRIAAGSAEDAIGNAAAASAVSHTVTVDNTPAILTSVAIASSGDDGAYAKERDTVTLSFTANEPLSSAEVEFCGRSVIASSNSEKALWTAHYTIPSGTTLPEGEMTFTVLTTDLAGNEADIVSATTDGSAVTLDFTVPEITLTGDFDADGGYYTGAVTVEFDEGDAVLTDLIDGGDTSVHSGDEITASGRYRLTVTDDAGNEKSVTFVLSGDYYDVMSDKEALAITYAPGDNANHVTRDVTLPVTGAAGCDISWSSDDGAVNAETGAVARPAAGEDNAIVTLTATISKNGITSHKAFTLTVFAQAQNSDLGRATEDAESAVIVYAEGDSRDSVTLDLGLADTGVLHASALTWESDSEYVTVSETAEDGCYTATVKRPDFSEGNVRVRLTVTAVCGEESYQKSVTVTVIKQAGSEEQAVETDADEAYIAYQPGDSKDAVTENITFVFEGAEGSTGVWSSGNEDVIFVDGDTGIVSRPTSSEEDAPVTVTLTVTNGEYQTVRTFDLTVKKLEATSQQDAFDVEADLDALEIGYHGTDTKDSVTTHLILAARGANGSVVTWSSSAPTAVASNGTVSRKASGDIAVTLTATVTKGEAQASKTFTVTVKQLPLTLLQQLGTDADKVAWGYISAESIDHVTNDLVLSTRGACGCTVTWTSGDSGVITASGNVNRAAEETQVILTAVIEKEGFFIVKVFTVTVAPK